MMSRIDVKVGDVYGRLTVLHEIGGYPRKFECLCSCGNKTDKYLSNLRNSGERGSTKSCGCIRSETTIARNLVHGLAGTPEHEVWCGIKKRCGDKNSKDYVNYGGRGIGICAEWSESFESFLSHVGSRPSPQHSIDRFPNNDGNYEPGNVRWATRTDQNRNTRVSRMVEIDGAIKCVSEWDSLFSESGVSRKGNFKSNFYRYGLDRAVELMKDRS